jgi:hypothetical protein
MSYYGVYEEDYQNQEVFERLKKLHQEREAAQSARITNDRPSGDTEQQPQQPQPQNGSELTDKQ